MAHGGDIYRNKVNIDFSVNLNPLPVPGAVREAAIAGLEKASLYPDIKQDRVRNALAALEGVTSGCVYSGSGASELIMACVRAVAPGKVLLCEPCYSGYMHALRSVEATGLSRQQGCRGSHGIDIREYRLNKANGFRIDRDILDHMTEDIDLMFLTDPWNPTGTNIEDTLLSEILDRALACHICVILDLSFLPMSDKFIGLPPFYEAELINKYDNLFIIKSFTKLFALPGLRMGYVISSQSNITDIICLLPEWNLSSVAAETMIACADVIKNTGHVCDSVSLIRREREYLTGALRQLGYTVYDSDTSFILLETEQDLYNKLLENGILIRDCSDYRGLEHNFYRIAVREHASNEVLIRCLASMP